jgi:hypothetical protein
MKVLWQDAVGSFLDPSGSDPVPPNGDAGAPSAGGSVAFGTEAVLWNHPGTAPGGGATADGNPPPDTWPPSSSGSSHLVWSDPGNGPPIWNITETWFSDADPTGGPGGADGKELAPNQPTTDAASLVWQPAASLPQPAAPVAQPTAPAVPQNGSPANTGASVAATGTDSGGCEIDGKWYADGMKNIPLPDAATQWNQVPAFLECRDGVAYFQNTSVPWQPVTFPSH